MKTSKFWTYCIIATLFVSCGYSEGNWGATLGDCGETCTVYYTAQRKLMENRELYDRDFPDKELRRKHVTEIDNGHQIKSWFKIINEQGDTVKTDFSCEVYLSDYVEIGYYVENLKIKEN